MPQIIAVSNQKGGVGKTTTTINLAAALAHNGYRTLVVDLDPQGNATSGLGNDPREIVHGIYDLMLGDVGFEDAVLDTGMELLELLPADPKLVGAEVELTTALARETKLARALEQVPADVDFILMDCPPSLGFLTINALTAADSVLIPVQAEYYALEGLGQLLRTMSEVQRALNPRLVREGLVLTLHDHRNNLCKDVEAQLRQVFKGEVFESVIPRNVRLGEAPSHGLPVIAYAPTCRGAKAYLKLADELLDGHILPEHSQEIA
ncbi:MAG: ParA family protein [Myxococcota bacterium]|nr:ParA family protein [Myxococcota bacterium]